MFPRFFGGFNQPVAEVSDVLWDPSRVVRRSGRGEDEINRESGAPPKHEKMGAESCDCGPGGVVSLADLR